MNRTVVDRTAAAPLLGVLAGCAAPPQAPVVQSATPGSTATVGRIIGSDALIGVTTAGNQVVAYVCDGEDRLGERFAGTLEPGPDGLRAVLGSAGGATLAVTVDGGDVRGTFTAAGGGPAAFVTEPAVGDAGLYLSDVVVDGARVSAGWVLLADGIQDGTVVRDHRKAPAPPVERVVGTRPPTAPATSRPAKPRPTPDQLDGIVERGRKKVESPADVARSTRCIADPSRCL